ncbi:helix-turn-helix domain-containing protein [Paenibacillus aceti]|uniref:HTH-type transcriptional regulator YtdP n=1 Tax=Paenibacillus aceti TaxID=1820010 RepID=A0ABQ1W3Z5_9BACL|nr:helix-turn-helix domain-containing protein [Paenibacillus aceti]GGG13983.1 putative HTH-type transcriptional regulator YtdP [Paenibacillus aceti]
MIQHMFAKLPLLRRPNYHKQKLIIYMLLLSTIPVLIFGLFITNILTSTIQDQASMYNKMLVQNAQDRMHDQLKKIDELLLQYTYSSRSDYTGILTQYANKELSANDIDTFRQIKNILANIRSGMEDVIEVDFYSFHSRKILTSDNQFLTEEQFRDSTSLDKARQLSIQGVWIDTRTSLPANTRINQNVLTLIRPVAEDSSMKKSITGAIIAYLDADALGNKLASKNNYDTHEIFVVNESGQIVFHNDRNYIGTRLSEPNLTQIKQAETLEPIKMSLNGTPSVMNVKPARNQNWYYVSSISEAELYRNVNHVKLLVYSVAALLVLIASIIALHAATSLYRPVRNLTRSIQAYKQGDAEDNDNATGRNEIERVTRTIHTMLRHTQQLEKNLERYKDKMETHTLHQYLVGNIQEPDARSDLRFSPNDTYIAVILLEFDPWKLYAQYPQDDQYLLYFAIENIAHEVMGNYGNIHTLMMHPGRFLTLVAHSDVLEAEQLRKASNHLLETIQQYLKLSATLSVSYSLQGLTGLPEAYKQADQAARYRFVLHEEQTIFINELDPATSMQFEDIAELTYKILDKLKLAQIDEAEAEFIHLMEGLKDGAVFPVQSIHGFFSQLVGSIYRCLQVHHSIVLTPERHRALLSSLSAQQTLGEVEAFFSASIFGVIRECLTEKSQPAQAEQIRQLTQYIHEHYDQDISLQHCADRMEMNTFQVSRLFKKHTGQNFVDYVIQYRIEQAKSMLMDTDMRIQDIADKLRYNSVQSFIRTFKKTTGMTPGQYRKQFNKDEE